MLVINFAIRSMQKAIRLFGVRGCPLSLCCSLIGGGKVHRLLAPCESA
jgi:hypothetical protein